MKLNDARKLRKGDRVFFQGVPMRVQRLGQLCDGDPPRQFIHVRANDGSGPMLVLHHIEVTDSPDPERLRPLSPIFQEIQRRAEERTMRPR